MVVPCLEQERVEGSQEEWLGLHGVEGSLVEVLHVLDKIVLYLQSCLMSDLSGRPGSEVVDQWLAGTLAEEAAHLHQGLECHQGLLEIPEEVQRGHAGCGVEVLQQVELAVDAGLPGAVLGWLLQGEVAAVGRSGSG